MGAPVNPSVTEIIIDIDVGVGGSVFVTGGSVGPGERSLVESAGHLSWAADPALETSAHQLPEGWVAYTTSPAPADDTKRYGAHFWLQVPDEYAGEDARLPVPAFHAAGHEAQFVTIVPSRDAVIVRLGRTRYPDAWDHPAFVRDVLARLSRFDHSRPGG